LVKMASATRLEQVPLHADLPPADHHEQEQQLLAEHIVAYRIDGPLLFAAAHRFLLELADVADVRVMILRMSRISAIDTTGARILADTIDRLQHRGTLVLISGIRAEQRQILDTLATLGRMRTTGLVFDTTPEAITAARAHLHTAGVLPALPLI
jgi:sulfate permease, SulP family